MAHSNLANGLGEQGKFEDAIDECRESLRLKPGYAQAHTILGVIKFRQGKLDEAVEELRKALHTEPDHAEAHCNLGRVLRERGSAMRRWKNGAGLRSRPDYPEAHNNLGFALVEQGRLNEAVAEFRAAIRLKPDFFDAHW